MITIRKATKRDLSSIAKIRIDNWQTTYIGLLPQSFLDDLNYEKETSNWLKFSEAKDAMFYVATNAKDEILGFVADKISINEDPKIGEIYALHTAEAHRGKGVGKALIYFSAKQFKANNINQMKLWVVVGNNQAISIYEHLGAVIYSKQVEIINGVNVPEIGMKWNDLSTFLQK